MHLCLTIETESLDVDYICIPVLYIHMQNPAMSKKRLLGNNMVVATGNQLVYTPSRTQAIKQSSDRSVTSVSYNEI